MGMGDLYGSRAMTGGRYYEGDPDDPKNKAAQKRRDARFYEDLAAKAAREAEQIEMSVSEEMRKEYGPPNDP
jgi:hypothetical protein